MKNNSKWFWGLFFILGGSSIIINELGYFTSINLYTLVFSIFLTAVFIKSAFNVNWWGMLFTLAILCIIYSKQLGLEMITPWPVLITAFFSSIGLSILFYKPKRWCKIRNSKDEDDFDRVINDKDDNVIDFGVSFGSSIKYVNSEELEKANFSCNFGSLKLYLDNAKISKKGAIINIDASFSGVELYIPKDWNIVNDIQTSLGGVEEKNRRHDTTGPVVRLTGNVSFSGVEIYYI